MEIEKVVVVEMVVGVKVREGVEGLETKVEVDGEETLAGPLLTYLSLSQWS